MGGAGSGDGFSEWEVTGGFVFVLVLLCLIRA